MLRICKIESKNCEDGSWTRNTIHEQEATLHSLGNYLSLESEITEYISAVVEIRLAPQS